MRKSLLALSLLAATSAPVMAADYSDGDIHKNDYKWMQFNLMGAFDELPGESSHDYLEMEFGGRSGIFDLYGYVDVFNLASDPGSDKDGAEKIFMKFAPRMSLDALTGKDLSFGPVQELYVASLMEWGGNSGVNSQKIGLGSDVMVPWLGKIGLNLYGTYDGNNKDWNGFQISTNWFKPFYFFENGSFISYQGYIDYQFGMNDDVKELNTTNGGAMFNGIYWHSDRFAVGYGLKGYKDVYGLKDGGWAGKTSGFGHYLAVTYKF
ncbi:Nucleoside-specific channel-forming protein [Vibrio sp. B1FLJ16]|uniref:nucleoside-specific channel-forming Tsx family protein n=1 Tax=Vibrio sp. B1FLJ16 TaxID=2751178 RepID=UPI0015F4B38C|nr:outer membrane protein OmpK [Vibrio sp. B1FLJ16]CAD7809969.1 Nucleoside-specific channel-forming protein [Vibrio sp. B1FLJ16]CAE6911016.1 Nucleoside-specific channel-forming protein [Vibrio sp. B1FLJ16]